MSYPYLSIVIPCRNDEYAGNMLEKLLASLTILIAQLNRYSISSEIIIVDWNPPKERKTLSEELVNFPHLGLCSLRVIEVGASFHNNFFGSDKKGIVGCVALNTGIRRAKGLFVTSKMADTYFSGELMAFIGKQSLSPDCVYRADRLSVDIDSTPINKNWQQIFEKKVTYRGVYNGNGPHLKACGDFFLMTKVSWFKIRGFHEPKSVIGLGEDGEALYAAIGIGLTQICLLGKLCVFKIQHSNGHASRIASKKVGLLQVFQKLSYKYRSILGFLYVRSIVTFFFRLILGLFNLPRTKIHGLQVRSHYRWYLIALFRLKFGGARFLGRKDWGLSYADLKETNIKEQ